MEVINKSQKVFLLFVATIWFFVSIDAFFIWGSLGGPLRIAGTAGMFIFSLLIVNKWVVTARNLPVMLFILLYCLWLMRFNNFVVSVAKLFDFIPFLLVLLWPKAILKEWHGFIRKIIIFFAIGSTVVTVLSLVGVLEYIPHFTLSAHSQLHKFLDYQYDVYGVFVTIRTGYVARACGPLHEPGHWAIILGFFYLIDRFSGRKINLWIVIGGLMTFSLNFFLMFVFVEFHNLFSKNFGKTILYSAIAAVVILIMVFVLPPQTKETLEYMIFERNADVISAGEGSSGSLTGALDARAGDYSLSLYESMDRNSLLFGTGYSDSSSALSDYRGTILYMGVVGLALSILLSLSILMLRAPWRLRISLFLCLFLVFLHRGWMMYYAYLFFLSYLAIAVNGTYQKIENEKTA